MLHNSVLYDSAKTWYLIKIWFFSYGLKCSQPSRLHYILIISISGRNQSMPESFCVEIIFKRMWNLVTFSGIYSSTNWRPFTGGQNSNLKLSFETQSFKPKNRKVIKTVQAVWREPYLFFFTFRSHQLCKESVQKEKLQSTERNVCTWQMSFSAIFVSNKITLTIFQIIYIRNKTLDPYVNGGLERRPKVQTCL